MSIKCTQIRKALDGIHRGCEDIPEDAEEKVMEDTVKNEDTSKNKIDELREYKMLLDEGIINQEEFDTKKKQILDI